MLTPPPPTSRRSCCGLLNLDTVAKRRRRGDVKNDPVLTRERLAVLPSPFLQPSIAMNQFLWPLELFPTKILDFPSPHLSQQCNSLRRERDAFHILSLPELKRRKSVRVYGTHMTPSSSLFPIAMSSWQTPHIPIPTIAPQL